MSKELREVCDRSFENERVLVDGNIFIRCSFLNCILEFRGVADFSLRDSNRMQCNWAIAYAAFRTMRKLAGLYSDVHRRSSVDRVIETLTDPQGEIGDVLPVEDAWFGTEYAKTTFRMLQRLSAESTLLHAMIPVVQGVRDGTILKVENPARTRMVGDIFRCELARREKPVHGREWFARISFNIEYLDIWYGNVSGALWSPPARESTVYLTDLRSAQPFPDEFNVGELRIVLSNVFDVLSEDVLDQEPNLQECSVATDLVACFDFTPMLIDSQQE